MVGQQQDEPDVFVTFLCRLHSPGRQTVKSSVPAYNKFRNSIFNNMPFNSPAQKGIKRFSRFPVTDEKTDLSYLKNRSNYL